MRMIININLVLAEQKD